MLVAADQLGDFTFTASLSTIGSATVVEFWCFPLKHTLCFCFVFWHHDLQNSTVLCLCYRSTTSPSFGGCFCTQFFSIVTFNVLAVYPFGWYTPASWERRAKFAQRSIATSASSSSSSSTLVNLIAMMGPLGVYESGMKTSSARWVKAAEKVENKYHKISFNELNYGLGYKS